MLAGSGFCNDALLAHAQAEQRLAQRVVDLVCPRVVQILALQVDLRPSPIRPGTRQKWRGGSTFNSIGSESTAVCMPQCVSALRKMKAYAKEKLTAGTRTRELTVGSTLTAALRGTGAMACPRSPSKPPQNRPARHVRFQTRFTLYLCVALLLNWVSRRSDAYLELRVLDSDLEFLLQLCESRNQRLWDVLATELAVAAVRIRPYFRNLRRDNAGGTDRCSLLLSTDHTAALRLLGGLGSKKPAGSLRRRQGLGML